MLTTADATKLITAGGAGASATIDVYDADVVAVQVVGTSGAAAGTVKVQRTIMRPDASPVFVDESSVVLAGTTPFLVTLDRKIARTIKVDTTGISGGAVDVYVTKAQESM